MASGEDGILAMIEDAFVTSRIFQVNEEGSEAAAATGAVMMMR